MNRELPSPLRSRAIEFLIHSSQVLEVSPIVKYSALSLFADRFLPALSRSDEDGRRTRNWLLDPIRESNLQLFALTSIWISSKIHDTPPLSVETLKLLGNKYIKEQHYTKRDLLEAEIVLMQIVEFGIGTLHISFVYVKELHNQMKVVAQTGMHANFDACMDILDLLYEKKATSVLYNSPSVSAASILVASYIISVPAQSLEFPVLSWVKFVSSCKEDEILRRVSDILKLILEPASDHRGFDAF